MSNAAKSIWEAEGTLPEVFWRTGRLPFPVYDVHGHMGYHPAIFMSHAEPETMARHLRRAGARLVFTHHDALNDWSYRNQAVHDIVARFPDVLRMYVAINPHAPANIEEDLARYDDWPYAIGLKFLADYHRVAVTDERYERAMSFADERGLPILFHTWGGSSYDGAGTLLELTRRHPHAIYLFGHSFYGDWKGVRKVFEEAPARCYFELTSIPGQAGYIERLVDIVGADRILFGTDLPWFSEFQAIGGVLAADISDDARRAILHDNALAVFGDALPAN